MMVAIEELPDDSVLLKRVIAEERAQRNAVIERIRQEVLADRNAVIERIKHEAAEQMETLRQRLEAEHKAVVDAILRRYYGPRREKFDPRQLLLFGLTVDALPLDRSSVEDESGERLVTRRVKNRHEHGRGQLPEHLERIEIEHDLDEKEKACPACGQPRQRIGAEVSEQLEYFPASFKVLKHIRHKYGCPCCEGEGYNPNLVTAAQPAQPIPKGLPGPSLLAHVITGKLGDHLPLYRLERIFGRHKVSVARSTMCAWMRAAGEMVVPLVDLMTGRVKASRVVHTDDTPVPIQSPGARQCRKGRIWCYLGDEANPYTVYDYTPNRSRDGPARWLKDYEGYLQADAYGGYDGIYSGGRVTEVACWAHARRKFYDAQDSDARRSAEMLALVGKLYAVERELKSLDGDASKSMAEKESARLALRRTKSVPVLAAIKAWLDVEGEIVLPRSPMAQAITYTQNQWSALCVYATRGFLAIDNNASERALKRVAIGRKNWLFAGNDEAAASHARLWSLIASAERHGVDPQRYLTSVLAKLPLLGKLPATPSAELEQFLPDVWAKDDAAEAIPPR
ncbi:MAG: IS66 family transposase [Pirellulales bacterium]|nr:IS66 family transposase [Pirellulales bacterium]